METPNQHHDLTRWLEEEPQPLSRAIEAMDRWSYIYHVANAAISGRVIDSSLPQIIADPVTYLSKAREAVQALWEWTMPYCMAHGIPLTLKPQFVEAPPAA